eukprot:CAMPEP_0115753614 /NCGR_PEP_ID=MMETSP0272-20121206/96424_1 /TAXON_ID=71861 /ORGANISM="Scrippsiella trochoidea, Strain CCMP3099" /LENGTH=103 /DNA_ID=CAMNT_0003198953 /DNA_START=362 /DNA_END=668 /DNA_ORIENTATION=+
MAVHLSAQEPNAPLQHGVSAWTGLLVPNGEPGHMAAAEPRSPATGSPFNNLSAREPDATPLPRACKAAPAPVLAPVPPPEEDAVGRARSASTRPRETDGIVDA